MRRPRQPAPKNYYYQRAGGATIERGKKVIEHDVISHHDHICCFVFFVDRTQLRPGNFRRGNIDRAHATLPSLNVVCALVLRQELDGSFVKTMWATLIACRVLSDTAGLNCKRAKTKCHT